MSDMVLLSRTQMASLILHSPRSRGKRWVDDWRVISRIIYVIRIGSMGKDAPRGYGPHKTLYNLTCSDVTPIFHLAMGSIRG